MVFLRLAIYILRNENVTPMVTLAVHDVAAAKRWHDLAAAAKHSETCFVTAYGAVSLVEKNWCILGSPSGLKISQ